MNDDKISMKSLSIAKNKSQKQKKRLLSSPNSLKSTNT